MIDLESMASRKNACVIELAAVRFSPHGEGIHGKPFQTFVWHKEGYISLSTIAWWMQQPHAAEMGRKWKEKGERPKKVLDDFTHWFFTSGPQVRGIWSHGASFDLAVLTSLCDENGVRVPWEFRTERDTRTIFWLVGGPPDVESDDLTKHEAVSDCIYQVRQIQSAVSQLKAMGVDVPLE